VVQRVLAMEYGVVPVLVQAAETLEDAWSAILEEAEDLGLASTGDVVELTGATELSVPGPRLVSPSIGWTKLGDLRSLNTRPGSRDLARASAVVRRPRPSAEGQSPVDRAT
jgi:hypothetical protein